MSLSDIILIILCFIGLFFISAILIFIAGYVLGNMDKIKDEMER